MIHLLADLPYLGRLVLWFFVHDLIFLLLPERTGTLDHHYICQTGSSRAWEKGTDYLSRWGRLSFQAGRCLTQSCLPSQQAPWSQNSLILGPELFWRCYCFNQRLLEMSMRRCFRGRIWALAGEASGQLRVFSCPGDAWHFKRPELPPVEETPERWRTSFSFNVYPHITKELFGSD